MPVKLYVLNFNTGRIATYNFNSLKGAMEYVTNVVNKSVVLKITGWACDDPFDSETLEMLKERNLL